MDKKNIAIIMGGFSSEYEISIKSGNIVYNYLDATKYNLYRIIISKDKWTYLDEDGNEHPFNKENFGIDSNPNISFDCVFNAVHGTPGEDGLLQAYFELLSIPQTSCGHYQAAITFNKRDLLSIVKEHGVKCADSYFVDKGDKIDETAIVEKVGLPCFVKANKAGSSFGISKVYEQKDLIPAIEKSFLEDDEIIIESFLDGIEVSVGVITYKGEVKVLPLTEIVSENDFFDFEAKYEGKSQEITPARISEVQKKKVSAIAKRIYQLLKLTGFSRSEYIFVGDEPYLLEVNTTPGLTEESILPQQAKAAGISLPALFESSVEEALKP